MSVTVMPQKPMAAMRPLCSTCRVKWAWLGERECGDCLMETRLAIWLLSEQPLPGEPTPWAMSVDQALEWVSSGVIHPVIHSVPRIQEVPPLAPMARRRQEEALASSVMAWAGLAALVMFALGWLMGSLGC